MTAIETINLTRNYGSQCAVDHLTMSVASGDLLAFLGPNGAGKTTTIRMLTGLLRPNEGTAWSRGTISCAIRWRSRSRSALCHSARICMPR